ncbi:MAG: hypothetical protein WD628_02865 [Thermomicrobiales bacterium]
MSDERIRITAEMSRTAFQRKAVSRLPANEVMDAAVAFFKERGYRSGRTGRPNQVFVMGGREGILPRVTAEILVQANVGKGKVTMLTISGFGEGLSAHLAEFVASLRAGGSRGAAPTEPES